MSGLCKKSKVSTLDIRIKQSGLKVSDSKVPSSGHIFGLRDISPKCLLYFLHKGLL